MSKLLIVCLALVIVGLVFHLGIPKLATVGDRMFFAGLLALVLLASQGCCSTERSGETLTLRIRRDRPPATSCDYRTILDGEVQMRGVLAQCPVVPVCEEPR